MNNDWQAAVEVRGELARWFHGAGGVAFTRGFAKSAGLSGSHMVRSIQRELDDAEATYWVAEEVLDVVRFAADSLPRFELRPSDLLTPSGVLVFEEDQYLVDVHGRPVSFRAVSWHHGQSEHPDTKDLVPGIGFTLYTNKHAEGDWYMRLSRGLDVDPPAPRVIPWDSDEEWRAEQHDSVATAPFDLIPTWSLAHRDTWRFGDTHEDLEAIMREGLDDRYAQLTEEQKRTALTNARHYREFMLACWLLMQQPVTMNVEGRVHRQAEKRLKRDPLTANQPSRVQVIKLRRPANPQPQDGDPEARHYSHRFIVRGHWRMQFYPSEGRHKPLWIEAFVKGPEGAPLVTKHKVFTWVR